MAVQDDRAALDAMMADDPGLSGMAEKEAKRRKDEKPSNALHFSQAKDGILSAAKKKKVPNLETYDAAELYTKKIEKPPVVVNDFLSIGLAVLAGAPKRGKSWMALKLAICVAAGTPFLGMRTRKGAVLYMDLESKEYRLKERLEKLLPGPAPRNLKVTHKAENLDTGLKEQLEAWIDSVENPSLIIIDTLGRVKGSSRRNENAYESDTRTFGALQSFALSKNICIVLIHHLRKGSGGGNGTEEDYFERISGSMGLSGACDTVSVLVGKRGEATSTLRFTPRDFDSQDIVVSFNGGDWRFESKDNETYKEECEYNRSKVVCGIIRLLHEQPNGRWYGTASQLKKAIECAIQEPFALTSVNEFGREVHKFQNMLLQRDRIKISMRRTGKSGMRELTLEALDISEQIKMTENAGSNEAEEAVVPAAEPSPAPDIPDEFPDEFTLDGLEPPPEQTDEEEPF